MRVQVASFKISSTGIVLESEHLGCYRERPSARALPTLLEDSPQMTPLRCRELALSKRFRFYAVRASSQCYAGGAPPTFYGKVEGGCTATCAGDAALRCGGELELLVYQNPAIQLEALGCFDDRPGILQNVKTLDRMTPQLCRQWALDRGFNYWGMRASSQCLGEQLFEDPPGLQESGYGCNEGCAGDGNQACGGKADEAVSLFRVLPDNSGGEKDGIGPSCPACLIRPELVTVEH